MLSTMQPVPLQVRQLLDHARLRHADADVHTSTETGTRTATYAEVASNASRLAHALRALGVVGDTRIATYMWNNQEHLEAYYAVPGMGAVLHPLNIRLAAAECAYIANDAGNQIVIVDAALLATFAEILPLLTHVRHVIVNGQADTDHLKRANLQIHDYSRLIAGQDDVFDWPDVDENSAAVMCYTSGTTGNPKGVAYSHRSIYLHALAIAQPNVFDLSWNDRIAVIVPQFHALAWGLPYAAFLTGAGLALPDRFMTPDALVGMISSTRSTRAAAVPTIWLGILDRLRANPAIDISSLEEAIVGGGACPMALIEAYDKLGVRLLSAWGMTELSPVGTSARPPKGVSGADALGYRIMQGRFLGPVQARLAGPDGTRVPHDGVSVGELEVAGPWVTGAYFGGHGADRFAEDGWLRTGDLGSITADGYFRITDRSKDVIKSGGEWISSVDLENHLLAHENVAEAVVVGIPDERWGERPLAALVLRDNGARSPEAYANFVAGRFAKWQVPDHWAFVSSIPKTSAGKLDKVAMRRLYHDGQLEVLRR